jgi:hypothetical protein
MPNHETLRFAHFPIEYGYVVVINLHFFDDSRGVVTSGEMID